MTDLEVRSRVEPVSFRAAGDGKPATAVGYAYKFGTRSQDLGGFVEMIAPGAGARSLAEDDVVALANHDKNLLLGRSTAGTLRASEDGTGGAYEIDLPDTSVGRDWATLLERRDVVGSSFGFRVAPEGDEWSEDSDGRLLRTLHNFSVRDVGPVTFPAYLATEAALRSLAEAADADLDEVRAADDLTKFVKPNRARVVIHAASRWAR